jgi:hypothetical protein
VADDILTRAFKRAEEEMSRLKMVNASLHDEIERLRAAGDAMAEWLCLDVAHYEECATMHSDWPEVCNCGADKLRRAWNEARRG